jgi:hypothetical protein
MQAAHNALLPGQGMIILYKIRSNALGRQSSAGEDLTEKTTVIAKARRFNQQQISNGKALGFHASFPSARSRK